MFLKNAQGVLCVPVILLTCFVIIFGFACVGTFVSPSMNMMSGDAVTVIKEIMPQCCGAPLAHAQSWKEMFIAVPRGWWNVILALILWMLAFFALIRRTEHPRVVPPTLMSLAWYAKHNAHTRLFNYIHTLFARGILNPKIF